MTDKEFQRICIIYYHTLLLIVPVYNETKNHVRCLDPMEFLLPMARASLTKNYDVFFDNLDWLIGQKDNDGRGRSLLHLKTYNNIMLILENIVHDKDNKTVCDDNEV
ncbi:MAG: hypothetical protein WBO70_00805 [Erysipelotrichaceae bacterium]